MADVATILVCSVPASRNWVIIVRGVGFFLLCGEFLKFFRTVFLRRDEFRLDFLLEDDLVGEDGGEPLNLCVNIS